MHYAGPNVWSSKLVSQIDSTEQTENYTESDGKKHTEYQNR